MVKRGQVVGFPKHVAFQPVTRAATLLLLLSCAVLAQTQTFHVLHSFTNTTDGSAPVAGVTLDQAGNLYGSTTGGSGSGAIFRLKRSGSGWVLTPLYKFHGTDGSDPQARMTIGPDGSLYGTTPYGGAFDNGTVYNLRPPVSVCRTSSCPWTERVLYSFQGGDDGLVPFIVEPVFDQLANLYGTTYAGGSRSPAGGVIFKLSPSGGAWTESTVYSFGGTDHPYSGVVFDAAGNLYGTTTNGGVEAYGYVFQFNVSSGALADLHDFHGNDGAIPIGGLITDASGKIYGTTSEGGPGGGVVFELTPGSPWNFSLLTNLVGGSLGNLAMDSAGNLYGTTYEGGAFGFGSIFQMTPTSGGGWTYTTLHDFTDGADGGLPMSGPMLDRNGNLYGTASSGGQLGGTCPEFGCGVVWEIAR